MTTRAQAPVCVVVGSGSAGRRHATALRTLLPTCRLVVVRRAGSEQPTADLEAAGAELVETVHAAAAQRPLLAIIAGPATTRVDDAVPLLDAGAALLVEKPLAASTAAARDLAAAAEAAARPVVLGYHLRFDDVASRFGALVREQLAPPRSFDLRVGQHLGAWRLGVRAERSVSARHELGGGVLLELSHEIDAVLATFGPVAAVRAALRRDGAPTDGVVETVADLQLTMASGAVGRIHLDMVSDPPFRTWTARSTEAEVTADLLAGCVTLARGGTVATEQVPAGWRDRAELRLVEHALSVAGGGLGPRCGADDGLDVLAVIDAARSSAAGGALVEVRPPARAAVAGGS
jgi:predicted dehydrogenase